MNGFCFNDGKLIIGKLIIGKKYAQHKEENMFIKLSNNKNSRCRRFNELKSLK